MPSDFSVIFTAQTIDEKPNSNLGRPPKNQIETGEIFHFFWLQKNATLRFLRLNTISFVM